MSDIAVTTAASIRASQQARRGKRQLLHSSSLPFHSVFRTLLKEPGIFA